MTIRFFARSVLEAKIYIYLLQIAKWFVCLPEEADIAFAQRQRLHFHVVNEMLVGKKTVIL